MKHRTIYKNDEFEIYADENGIIYRQDSPYIDMMGRSVDSSWELIHPVKINLNNGERVCLERESVKKMEIEIFRGKIFLQKESFFDQIKFDHGTEAAEALCKYFKKELQQAEKRFQETR